VKGVGQRGKESGRDSNLSYGRNHVFVRDGKELHESGESKNGHDQKTETLRSPSEGEMEGREPPGQGLRLYGVARSVASRAYFSTFSVFEGTL